MESAIYNVNVKTNTWPPIKLYSDYKARTNEKHGERIQIMYSEC